MKYISILFVIAFALLASGCTKPTASGFQETKMNVGKVAVVNTSTQDFVSMDTLTSEMAKYDVIFVGEAHDHTVGHMIENQLLRNLYSKKMNLTVSFEMFERDTQAIVDAYLAGKITEEEFIKTSRPWPNYPSDYRPMLEFAKENNLPVVAANIPRRLAMAIGRGGLEGVKEEDKQWVAKELYAPEDDYQKRFFATMMGMGRSKDGKAMPMMAKNKVMLNAIYRAQCSKDDAMAESITDHIAKTGNKVIHYDGSFHSDYGYGTVARVRRNNPNLKVLVIKIMQVYGTVAPPFEGIDMKLADFIIMTER